MAPLGEGCIVTDGPLEQPRIGDLLLLFTFPPVCEVCSNYEVVMFQYRTGTPDRIVRRVSFKIPERGCKWGEPSYSP